MVISEGDDTAVLVNPELLECRGDLWMRTVVNALLAAAAVAALAVAS